MESSLIVQTANLSDNANRIDVRWKSERPSVLKCLESRGSILHPIILIVRTLYAKLEGLKVRVTNANFLEGKFARKLPEITRQNG